MAVSGPRGMGAFFTVWAGQLVSVVGTSLTGFGLQVWVYLETGSVTRLAMVSLAFALPAVVLSPIAGALVDRWDRRAAMLGADAAAGAATLVVAALHFTGRLEIWHVFVLVGVGSVANAFQVPAWMASVPLLVPPRHLGRANGLVQVNDAAALVVAPAAAGALLATLGLGAVLLADVVTFLVAVATLAIVRFPRPERPPEAAGVTIGEDVRLGWRYLRERTGLVWLLGLYAGVNFVLTFALVLLIPLIVAFSTETAAGAVFSLSGVGMLAASLAVSARGVPRRRVLTILAGIALGGAAVAVTGLRPSLLLIGAGITAIHLVLPVVNASSQVIWQTKVAPGVQGRVFALRRMISQAIAPIAILLAGPLADRVFEPLMADDGALAGTIGRILGTGPGRGIGLMFVLAGAGTVLLAGGGWMQPRLRHLEEELPDQPVPDALDTDPQTTP